MSRLLCQLSYTAANASPRSGRHLQSPNTESNRRPSPYHGDALPTELLGHARNEDTRPGGAFANECRSRACGTPPHRQRAASAPLAAVGDGDVAGVSDGVGLGLGDCVSSGVGEGDSTCHWAMSVADARLLSHCTVRTRALSSCTPGVRSVSSPCSTPGFGVAVQSPPRGRSTSRSEPSKIDTDAAGAGPPDQE